MKQFSKLLGFLLLGVILWKTDISELGTVLANANIELLSAAFCVSLLSIVCKAVRWNWMLATQGFKYPIHRALNVYLSGIYIGLATPGRLGELTRLLYLKRDFKASAGIGLSSVVLDRVFDLYALLAVGLIASIRFITVDRFSSFFLIGIAVFVGMPFLLLSPRFGRWFTKKLLGHTARKKFGKILSDGTEDFFDGLGQMLSWRLIPWGIVTIIAFSFFFWAGHLIASSLGIHIDFIDAALVLGLANLLSLIPITVAGVGTRDAVFVFAFATLALTKAQALAFSALVLAVFILGGGAIGFLCFLIDKPKGETQ
ncbi:MAG: flippase-like domain-containing protein [Proteobacteria bacterium]|nr:flippase-like domain-containing protein [Pseudomonadota bacterium]